MSRVWRAWRRWRRRGRKAGPIVLALVALDLLLKTVLVTPDWAWHQTPSSWYWEAVVVLLAGAVLSLASPAGGALLVAGAAGNLLAALHGPVANPFVLAGNLGFNLADCYLVAGMITVLVALPLRAVALRVRAIYEGRKDARPDIYVARGSHPEAQGRHTRPTAGDRGTSAGADCAQGVATRAGAGRRVAPRQGSSTRGGQYRGPNRLRTVRA